MLLSKFCLFSPLKSVWGEVDKDLCINGREGGAGAGVTPPSPQSSVPLVFLVAMCVLCAQRVT